MKAGASRSARPTLCGPRCAHPTPDPLIRPLTKDTPQAMEEIHKLRAQISRIVSSTFPGTDAGFVPKLPPPNETQVRRHSALLPSRLILTPSASLAAQGPPPTPDGRLHRPSRHQERHSRQVEQSLIRQGPLDTRRPLPRLRHRGRPLHPPLLEPLPRPASRVYRLQRTPPDAQGLAEECVRV